MSKHKHSYRKPLMIMAAALFAMGLMLGTRGEVAAANKSAKKSLGKLLQARKKRFLVCYKRALKGAPGLEGRLVMRFKITPKGKVTKATIARSNLAHVSLHACIVKELSGWSFPARGKSLVVSYPLHLTPGPPPSHKVKLGRLKKEQIQSVVRANMRGIKRCFEAALQVSPRLQGKVVVDFVISAKGLVARASIKRGTLRGKKVKGCIVSAVRTWRFPKPQGGGIVRVTYPFLFRP